MTAACPGASVGMTSQSTPASTNALRALRLTRSPRREAGFTISSTRSILLGANFIAVAALILVCVRSFDWSFRYSRSVFMLGAGIEPAWEVFPRDFKSLAATGFAPRAQNHETRRPAHPG